MNFELFKTNYSINPVRAAEYAQLLGVKLAQVQLWILRITSGK